MKTQYLGDSRDSFKWHYHDYTMNKLKHRTLGIIPMLRPSDGTKHGNLNSKGYSASPEIQIFCGALRDNQTIEMIEQLPNFTSSNYHINIHKPYEHMTNVNRGKYFQNVNDTNLCFVDACTGFEPKTATGNHVKYSEISDLLDKLPKCAVISVYQHVAMFQKYENFEEHFQEIKTRMQRTHLHAQLTAIAWRNDVMFVQISKCVRSIKTLLDNNINYCLDKEKVRTVT